MNTISVIIPVESNRTSAPVLDCLKNVDYPQEKVEIIMSIGDWPSSQRNQAASVAKGEILYFFNRDTRPQPDIFRKAVGIINRDSKIAGVGGVDITPQGNNYIQHLFGYAMGSYFAHWRMRSRYVPVGKERIAGESELLLSNMAFRKGVFLDSGGFNERLYPNEENELINRVSMMGYKFIYSPDIKICRDRRRNIARFMRQFYSYGQGRINQMCVEGMPGNAKFLLPVFFLVYLFVLLFFHDSPVFFIPLAVYLFLAGIDSAYLSLKNRKNLLILPLFYLIMHFSYASGMIAGFLRSFNRSGPGEAANPGHQIIYIKKIS